MTRMTDVPSTAPRFTPSMIQSVATDAKPFAILTLGVERYEIADVMIDEEERLAFRPEGEDTWTALDRTIEDGWNRVGADIVASKPTALKSFLQTHAVRLSGNGVEDELEFYTLGTVWNVSLGSSGLAAVAFDDRAVVPVRYKDELPDDTRDKAIAILVKAIPDLREHFDEDIDLWAYRIASGVSILPVM